MIHGYHATTPGKLARYRESGCILPPVRWWVSERAAREWMAKTKRTILLRIVTPCDAYPLPHMRGLARWSPRIVRAWEVL